MTAAHIIAIGGLGILALMLLYAHALYAGLPEPVRPTLQEIGGDIPGWMAGPGAVNWIDSQLEYWGDYYDRVYLPALIAEQAERFADVRLDNRALLRWADDGGPA